MKLLQVRPLALVFTALSLLGTAAQAIPSYYVSYKPASVDYEGNVPVAQTYVLSVTSPTVTSSGAAISWPLTVSVSFTSLSAPTGISSIQALAFISASPSTLTFTAGGQTQTTTITISVTSNTYAGDYAYQINTVGWPSGVIDGGTTGSGATVNENALIAVTDVPPQVVVTNPSGTAYTYDVSTASSVAIPIAFTLSVPSGNATLSNVAVTCMDASGNNTSVTGVSWSGSGTQSGSGTANFTTSTAGTYTVTVTATDTDSSLGYTGTGSASQTATVTVSGPPPTVTATAPTTLTYTYTLGGSAVAVSAGCSAVSAAGNITGLTATIAGPSGTQPVTLTTTGVGSATTATGSASLSISAVGTYTITYTATNAYGSSSANVSFTVTGVNPVPTISITSPANNASYQIASGASSVSVPYTLTGGTTYGTITAVTATLTGPSTSATTTISPTVTGLNTTSIAGSGTLTITAPGSYTISATDVNSGGSSATASTTFTVTQASAATEVVTWLPPISCGKSICGGSVMPISFEVSLNGTYVADTSIVVSVCQVYSDGTSSTPVLYTYNSKTCTWSGCNSGCWYFWWLGWCKNGSCSGNTYGCGNWNSGGWNACSTYYTINSCSKAYQLYFPTDTGVNTYEVQVFKQLSSNPSNLQLLATTQFITQKCGACYDNNGNQCQGKDDRYGNCNLNTKCWGNYQCGSNSWGGNGCYGNSDGGGCTNSCSYQGSSTCKSADNNSCNQGGSSWWGW